MPAEWEPHESVWLAWPYDKISFGSLNELDNKLNPERLGKIEKLFTEVVSALAESEHINLIVRDIKQHSHILENVRMFEADYADVWTRDYMPIFVKTDDGKLNAVKWGYNAYGEKFAALVKDNEVFKRLNTSLNTFSSVIEPGIVLEPGAIETNGQGILITTEQCLLKRNPKMSKADYEKIFAEHLGISKVIWLKEGIVGDHTDGHIDEVARFVAPEKILCAYEDDPSDANYQILKANYETLAKEFEAIKLPMPHMTYSNGEKAPVSYANFYIGNKIVLAGIFGDKNDEKALEILQSVFPDRKIVTLDCRELIYGGGGIHCMTREQPK